MVKAGLPEPQSPEDVMRHPPEMHMVPAPALSRSVRVCGVASVAEERFPVREFKEMNGAPKSR
jgi:hypothetical protein